MARARQAPIESSAEGAELVDEGAPDLLQHRFSRGGDCRPVSLTRRDPNAYSSAPGKLPTTPASTNSSDSRNASVGATPSGPKSPHHRPLRETEAAKRQRQQDDEDVQRHENPIVAERERDAESRSDHPGQGDADRLHCQRQCSDQPQIAWEHADIRPTRSKDGGRPLMSQPPSLSRRARYDRRCGRRTASRLRRRRERR